MLTSASLLARARAEDPEAWRGLVRIYAPLVYGWCRAAGLQPADAADLVQEVFASVFKGLDKYRGTGRHGSFRAWLSTITRRRLADYRACEGPARAVGGSTAYQQLLGVPEASAEDRSTCYSGECRSVWRNALEWLRHEFEPPTWQAFWKVVIERRKPAEVAAEMGTSVWAVYKAKSRVLRRLRQELDQLEQI